MSIHQLLNTALQQALESAEKAEKFSGNKRISFGSKTLLKKFPDLGTFADESLHMLLHSTQANNPWVQSVVPETIGDVAGLSSLRLTIDLAHFDTIAAFCGYQKLSERTDQQWLSYNHENGFSFEALRWQKWGNSIEQAVANIDRARTLLTEKILSLHQLSARLFLDAKRLEDKDIEQLVSIFPELADRLRQRKVMLSFHCKTNPDVCLIVENMDTYHYLRLHAPDNWMLVCGLGQRVTKQSVLNEQVVDLHASAATPDSVRQACHLFWQNTNSPRLYWGDLDSNGEQIFQTLKKQIPALQKWQPAYKAMQALQSTADDNVHQEAVFIDELAFE